MTRFIILFIAVVLLHMSVPVMAQTPVARIDDVGSTCGDFSAECTKRDAIFFVHGLNGDATTFTNTSPTPDFNWPEELKNELAGKNVDIYRIDYQATIKPWARKGSAALDSIVSTIFREMYTPPGSGGRRGIINKKPYRSINFITHSLGGNVIASYLHTVKSELGHLERARHGFVIYLGVPIIGSQMADFAGLLPGAFSNTSERLLQSLRSDNTFLPMLRRWRKAEVQKAAFFECRPVNLWVAIEHETLGGSLPVDPEKVTKALPSFAKHYGAPRSPRHFRNYHHLRVAKPESRDDPLYKWVTNIISSELSRLRSWDPQEKWLCRKPCYALTIPRNAPNQCQTGN